MIAACKFSHPRRLSRCLCLFGLFFLTLSAFLCNQQDNAHVVFVDGFFFSSTTLSKPAAPSQQLSKKNQVVNIKSSKIRIRTSQVSDIKSIAEMLSTAIVNNNNNKNSDISSGLSTKLTTNWKVKMDQLWAKADIEALLRVRLEAMQEGKRAVARVSDLYSTATSTRRSSSRDEIDEQEQLYWMWKTSERLRKCIQRASSETGEDNVWKRHNFAKPPLDASWLNHLQMSAIHVEAESGGQVVVGFCEVAMLSNPTLSAVASDDDDEDNDDEFCDVPPSSSFLFAPAITNLATALPYRRRGIASRLLRRAERYVQRNWGYSRLGLYVEKENKAAVALYQSLGYEPVTTCDGGDQLGELWYMAKELNNNNTPILSKQEPQEDTKVKKYKNRPLQTTTE
jgi:ribosomal protein S18 acetylase RimI-like enzyme